MSTDIVKYYLLCSVLTGSRKHILSDTKIDAIFTKKELDLYLRIQDGVYVAREKVIGGEDDARCVIIG